jgi:hypothetical protein
MLLCFYAFSEHWFVLAKLSQSQSQSHGLYNQSCAFVAAGGGLTRPVVTTQGNGQRHARGGLMAMRISTRVVAIVLLLLQGVSRFPNIIRWRL